jgi:hypothetical protein
VEVEEDSDTSGGGARGETVPGGRLGRKKRGKEERYFNWTEEIEIDLIDWWREHTSLYNTQLQEFHFPAKKQLLYQEKAAQIGNGCTGE